VDEDEERKNNFSSKNLKRENKHLSFFGYDFL
jgi:hypothetical protein